ncbi:hypothetical protein [Gryllotalpicola koreensis]|uniref:Potassium transporter Trk n=1 Tax=Gryllotalpicola koreensis TaxID=993086 RepID=A0ABP7ZPR4_9MICO
MTDERPDTPEPAIEPEAGPEFEVEGPAYDERVEPALVEVRRTPNYWNFMVLFAVLAGIAITIITFSLPYDAETATYSRGTVYGFALLFSVAFGLALGAVIALIAERVSRRSIRLVEAEKITGRLKDGDADSTASNGQ